jgi:hypothetical protein
MAMLKRGSSLSNVTVNPNWGRIKKASVEEETEQVPVVKSKKIAKKTSK